MKCVICDQEIPVKGTWTKGNNAEPLVVMPWREAAPMAEGGW